MIEKDAVADLLVVEGKPEADLNWLDDPGNSLRLIMKEGRIHTNTL